MNSEKMNLDDSTDKMRERIEAMLEEWSFPSSEWERNTVDEVLKLPVVEVMRPPEEQLTWMKMEPNQCHTNSLWMEDNDPEKDAKMVTGWWLREERLLHHSVVRQRGRLVCVTPVPGFNRDSFSFIPDPKIQWRKFGVALNAYRDGKAIGPGVRVDPEASLRETELIKQRLAEGMDPMQALRTS